MSKPVITFEVSQKEYDLAMKFCEEHNKLHGPSKAAMGGRFTWQFLSMTIGSVTQIHCSCGVTESLTDLWDM